MPPPRFLKAGHSQILRTLPHCPGGRPARRNPRLVFCPWLFTATLIKVRNEERIDDGGACFWVFRAGLGGGGPGGYRLRSRQRNAFGLQHRVREILEVMEF